MMWREGGAVSRSGRLLALMSKSIAATASPSPMKSPTSGHSATSNLTGVFIVFEGVDGCGKSTQVQRVAAHYRAIGRSVTVVREPGGTPVGETVRALVKTSEISLSHEAELFLFLAARAQLVADVIRPALARGDVVLCDRFVLSTIAYQGAGRGLNQVFVEDACRMAVGGLSPDFSFYIGITSEEARKRAVGRGALDRFELEDSSFRERVLRCYEAFVALRLQSFRVVNGMKPEAEVTREICEHLGLQA